MHLQSLLVGLVALTSPAIAAPVTGSNSGSSAESKWTPVSSGPATAKGIRLDRAYAGPVIRNGPAEVLKTYKKFNKPVPNNVIHAAAAVQSTRVIASPESADAAYIVPMYVGSNKQLVNMDFDTGSSDTWVFSNFLDSTSRAGHNYYTPSNSYSAQYQSGETWGIKYGDGSGASGVVYSDTIVVGAVTATSMAVEAATSVSSALVGDTPRDGLVGFASPAGNTCSPNKCTTFFYGVGHSFPQPVLTADLKPGSPGSYDLGFINTTKYTGSIQYTSINTQSNYWMINLNGYAVGSTTTSVNYAAIVDTGTTLVYLPNSYISTYYSQIYGAQDSSQYGGWVFPCWNVFPDFSIILNGVSYTIPGQYISWAQVDSSTCYGALQSSDGIGMNVLGDAWLKFQFVVFDYGSLRVGLAHQSSA